MANKAVALAVVVLVAVAATTPDWTLVSPPGAPHRFFMDLGTVVREGDVMKAWVLHDFDDVQSLEPGTLYRSAKTLNLFRCAARQQRASEAIYYPGNMGGETVVESTVLSLQDLPWRDVAPGTINEDMMQRSCR